MTRLRNWMGAAVLLLASGSTVFAAELCRGIALWLPFNGPEMGPDGHYDFVALTAPIHAMSDAEIGNLRRAGFDFVRLSVNPGPFLDADPAQRRQLSRRLRAFIARLIAADLNVVVDIHSNDSNPAFAPVLLVEDLKSPLVLRYRQLLRDVAGILKPFPASRVVFEPMNEPQAYSGAGKWQAMMEAIYTDARRVAPNLPLIVTGGQGGSIDGLLQLDPRPFRDGKTFFSFHYYDPMPFTHQGVIANKLSRGTAHIPFPPPAGPWVADAIKSAFERIGNDRSIPSDQKPDVMEAVRAALEGYATRYPPDKIPSDFNRVAQWADASGVPRNRIFFGEFGATAEQPGMLGARREDRAQWLKAVRTTAESSGFAWSLWNYRDSINFSLVADNNANTLDADAVAALGLSEPSACRR